MNPLKSWLVDTLSGGQFQGIRGPSFWVAISVRHLWKGFEQA